MGGLTEPDCEVFRINSPKYLRRLDEHLNSESVAKQFGPPDAYDSTAAILSRNRVPGSRANGNDNAREGKGARWKGRREGNWTECIENPGGSDNYQPQGELENEGA